MFVDVEFGDELHLALNFRVIGLNLSLTKQPIPGVTETVPSNRALMIASDSSIIRQAALVEALREREAGATKLRRAPSRLVTIPLLVQRSPGQTSAPGPMAHRTTWSTWPRSTTRRSTVSSRPTLEPSGGLRPLDSSRGATRPCRSIRRSRSRRQKYPRPRQWTPERILCLAGKITSFYPVRSPGGYQLLGRTPVDLYDPLQRNEVFHNSPVLPIAGERHRYVPIGEAEYHDVRGRSNSAITSTTSSKASTCSMTIWPGSRRPGWGGLMFEVISGGPQTTVQDLGRPGYLHTGMPPPAPSTASRYAWPIFWSGTIRVAAIWSAETPVMPVSRCSSDVGCG